MLFLFILLFLIQHKHTITKKILKVKMNLFSLIIFLIRCLMKQCKLVQLSLQPSNGFMKINKAKTEKLFNYLNFAEFIKEIIVFMMLKI